MFYRRLILLCVVMTLVLAAAPVQAVSPPVTQLYIPAIDVNVAILAISDRLYLPDGGVTWDLDGIGDQVGWLDPALFPQAGPGNTVLAGHLTVPSGSPGAFFELVQLAYGDFIYVLQSDGTTMLYRVVESSIVDDNDLSVVWDYGDGRLTLITCTAEPGYAWRRVVVAMPIGPAVCREPGGGDVSCMMNRRSLWLQE